MAKTTITYRSDEWIVWRGGPIRKLSAGSYGSEEGECALTFFGARRVLPMRVPCDYTLDDPDDLRAKLAQLLGHV